MEPISNVISVWNPLSLRRLLHYMPITQIPPQDGFVCTRNKAHKFHRTLLRAFTFKKVFWSWTTAAIHAVSWPTGSTCKTPMAGTQHRITPNQQLMFVFHLLLVTNVSNVVGMFKCNFKHDWFHMLFFLNRKGHGHFVLQAIKEEIHKAQIHSAN